MLGFFHRAFTGAAMLAASCGLTSPAHAQFFGGYCNPCGTAPVATMAPAWNYGPTAYAPQVYQTAAVSDCPCMKPVTETVYKDLDVVEYRTVEKPVKVAKLVTVMEEREVVSYQTVNEVKTVNVPSYVNQTINECRQVTQNNSYWRTAWQPIPKMSPCQYDGRPGLVGELNRLGYAFRNTITPNAIARREYVPNVVAYNVPVQRTVQVPTTRQVSYTVSRQVPVTTVQKVPVQKTVWEDSTVTAYEPYTVKKRVAIGTQTRMVYDSNINGGTATAAQPTPAATATGVNPTQSAASPKGVLKNNSYEGQQDVPIQTPVYRRQPEETPVSQPIPEPAGGPVATQPVDSPSVVRVATWHTTRRSATPTQAAPTGPELVAQK